MATITNRHANGNSKHDRRKKKSEDQADARKAVLSPTNGYQGEKTTQKANDAVQIGKTDTLSSPQSINENKKSERMSPTMNESSDNKSKRKNNGKTIKTTQPKEESRSTATSSVSISTKNISTEEATSSVPHSDESQQKDDSADSPSTTAKMRGHESPSTISEATTEHSTPAPSDAKAETIFPIHKNDAQHLTDFQLEKAKYFFHVNLDIENKEYVTWEDVEFYLLFHATAAGKEGSDGGDLIGRLNRAAKVFWDHVHDQVPLPDGKRDTLTLDQFLDSWASLIDYVVRTNQLPPIVQDLVKLGFELYSTDNGADKPSTIQPPAFDQLFQKMNIGRPYAIMAYKYLTENGTKPLDADKIDSLVKAVITSSDDEHDSHFLLPGFFKTIANSRNDDKDSNVKPESPVPEEELSQTSEKSSSTSSLSSQTPTLPSRSQTRSDSVPSSTSPRHQEQQQQQSEQLKPTPTPSTQNQQQQQQQQQPSELPSSPYFPKRASSPPSSMPRFQRQPSPSTSRSPMQRREHFSPFPHQRRSVSQNSTTNSPIPNRPMTSQQNPLPPQPRPSSQQRPKTDIQREDENIRSLLRYYHIDDGDVFEVSDGPAQRIVLAHPERPAPPYVQQVKQQYPNVQPNPPVYQNGVNGFPSKPLPNERTAPQLNGNSKQHGPRVEVQKDPPIRLRQEPVHMYASSPHLRSTYSDEGAAPKEDWQRKPKHPETHSLRLKKKLREEGSIGSDISSSRQEGRTKRDRTSDDEEKIVASVLKHLAPIVEKRVAEELRRIEDDETDQDEDDGFVPFPFVLAAGMPFFGGLSGEPGPQEARQQQPPQGPQRNGTSQERQKPSQTNGLRGAEFGGATFVPPPLFMAMMNDLARGGPVGEMPSFASNMPPPTRGPAGAEGFMMFVDDNSMMGGPSNFSTRPSPRF